MLAAALAVALVVVWCAWVTRVRSLADPIHVLHSTLQWHGGVGGMPAAIAPTPTGTLFVFSHLYIVLDTMSALSEMEAVWAARPGRDRFALVGAHTVQNRAVFYAWRAARGIPTDRLSIITMKGGTVAAVAAALRSGRHVIVFTEPYRQHQVGVWAMARTSGAAVRVAALHPVHAGMRVGQAGARLCVRYTAVPATLPKHDFMHRAFTAMYGAGGGGALHPATECEIDAVVRRM